MLDLMIVELMKKNQNNMYRGYDWSQAYLRPVQVKTTLLDRVLPPIGEALISLGLKLKDRSRATLTTERAHAPNFMIML